VAADNDPRQTNKNLGKSRAEGVEVELSYAPARRWTLGANASWLTTTVLDNSGLDSTEYHIGAELPFRPHYTGTAHADYTAGRFSTSLRVTVTGSQTVLTERFSGGRAAVDGYSLLGLRLSYNVSRSFSCFLAGDNLLNRYYETGFDRRGWPLRVRVGMRVTS
jgi:outer membrane receptor protein involved in Fe transport